MSYSIHADRARGLSVAIAIATMTALHALALAPSGASAAGKPFGKQALVFACFKAKGKNKGALRVVPHRKRCKKMRGWRAMSWSAAGGKAGVHGAGGNTGARGAPGERGEPGPAGTPGAAGQIEQSLVETVQTQTAQIQALTNEVTTLTTELTTLTTELTDLEATVSNVCAQIDTLTTQSDALLAGVADAGIVSGLLGGLVSLTFNTVLPTALGSWGTDCVDP